MCKISKDVDVNDIKKHLFRIANGLKTEGGRVKATLVADEHYTTVTAIIGDKVLCVNFMN